MTTRIRALICFLLVLWLLSGYSRQASCADPNPQQTGTAGYRPAAVTKSADIAQLEALIKNYTAAWKNYTNTGDREIFRYIKTGAHASDQVIRTVGKGSISAIYATIAAIDFSAAGEKSQVHVWGRIVNKVAGEGDSQFQLSEYSWTYEAEKRDNQWLLSSCATDEKIRDRNSPGSSRNIFINNEEYLIGDWVYFADPKEEGKLYRMTVAGKDSTKLLDESVRIVGLTYARAILYINRSRNNELWMMDSRKFGAKQLAMEFSDSDGSYFTDGFSIFRTADNGRAFRLIYARMPIERTRLTLTELKENWLYFFFFNDGAKQFYRVKTDGSAVEFLPDVKVDWRDED